MKATLIDHMGSDLKVVNAARRSFGKEKDTFDPVKDGNLIRYLARGCPSDEFKQIVEDLSSTSDQEQIREALNHYRGLATHWVPFAHCQLTFHVQMPIFVARQLIRHTVGVSISEMSRRYVDDNPEYWFPPEDGWRVAAKNVKQGSSDQCLSAPMSQEVVDKVNEFCDGATYLYRVLVDDYKVAPELARIILPQNTYTDWHWTISLVTAARICHQRLDAHAQKEIQQLAKDVYDAAMEKFPVSFNALMTYGSET